MRQLTLVGHKPGREGDQDLLATGRRASAADRLRLMLRLTVEEFNSLSRINVYDRARGEQILPLLSGGVIVMGREAWSCLGLPRLAFYRTVATPRAELLLVPHPSGRNRMYNARSERIRAAHAMRGLRSKYQEVT